MEEIKCLDCGGNNWKAFLNEEGFVHMQCPCKEGYVGISRNYLSDDGITVRNTRYIMSADGSYTSEKTVTRTA